MKTWPSAREEQRRYDGRVGGPGACPAREQGGEANQPFGDSAAAHDLAGQDEEGHRKQNKAVDPGKTALGDDRKVDVHPQQPDGPRDSQREGDRRAEHQQRDKNPDHRGHYWASCGGLAISEAIRTRAAHSIKAPPTPTAR
jgi:hypothetical protein